MTDHPTVHQIRKHNGPSVAADNKNRDAYREFIVHLEGPDMAGISNVEICAAPSSMQQLVVSRN